MRADFSAADKVASDTGATVVSVAQFPGGVKGTEGGYIQLMNYLVSSLAETLAGDAGRLEDEVRHFLSEVRAA